MYVCDIFDPNINKYLLWEKNIILANNKSEKNNETKIE